jgi:hypothetical protein
MNKSKLIPVGAVCSLLIGAGCSTSTIETYRNDDKYLTCEEIDLELQELNSDIEGKSTQSKVQAGGNIVILGAAIAGLPVLLPAAIPLMIWDTRTENERERRVFLNGLKVNCDSGLE